MASDCASGARWREDGDDPGQQPADPSRQAAAHHWRGNEVSGMCYVWVLSILPTVSPYFPGYVFFSSSISPPAQAWGNALVKMSCYSAM